MRYVFYSKETGMLHREVKHLDARFLAINTPPGHVALAHATAHPMHHRVDIVSGALVPLPRSTQNGDAREKERARQAARLEITNLERSQARPMREALLGDVTAIARLREIEKRIAELRKLL